MDGLDYEQMARGLKNLENPQFQAELEFYKSQGLMDDDISKTFADIVSQGNRAANEAKNIAYGITNTESSVKTYKDTLEEMPRKQEDLKQQKQNAEKTIKDYRTSVKSNTQSIASNKRKIRELNRKKGDELYFSSKRADTKDQIASARLSIKSARGHLRELKQNKERAHVTISRVKQDQEKLTRKKQTTMRKKSAYEARLAEKIKEFNSKKDLYNKLAAKRNKLMAFTRQQFNKINEIKATYDYAKQHINNFNSSKRSPEELGILVNFLNNFQMPKISLSGRIESSDLIAMFNVVQKILQKKEDKDQIKQNQDKYKSNLTQFIQDKLQGKDDPFHGMLPT